MLAVDSMWRGGGDADVRIQFVVDRCQHRGIINWS